LQGTIDFAQQMLTPGRKRRNIATGGNKKARVDELEHGRREIKALGLEEYCSVLQF
jgi:hypothetical protein